MWLAHQIFRKGTVIYLHLDVVVILELEHRRVVNVSSKEDDIPVLPLELHTEVTPSSSSEQHAPLHQVKLILGRRWEQP
jgi:hypothetical protein